MKSDIAIATVSWIRTKEEAKVVLETIKYLSQLDIPVIIADGGSPEQYKQKIRTFPNVTLLETKGLDSQLLISHQEAAKVADYIFYLHTDKLDFARDVALKLIKKYRELPEKGMFIPSRTAESRETYLPYQKITEEFLNYFIGEYIGIPKDYFAGPAIYPATLVKYLKQIKGEIGWGIEAYFYVLAKRLNMPFEFYPCYFTAPVDVIDEDEVRLYRLKIVNWQIEGFAQAVNLETTLS
jgi:hypothetical protein